MWINQLAGATQGFQQHFIEHKIDSSFSTVIRDQLNRSLALFTCIVQLEYPNMKLFILISVYWERSGTQDRGPRAHTRRARNVAFRRL